MDKKGSPHAPEGAGVSDRKGPQTDIEVVRDQRIVLRRMYLENRSHRLFSELKAALDFARILRRDQVLYLESKKMYCVEARQG